MFCTKCGRPLHDGDKFCAYCGTKVREEDRQEAAPSHSRYEEVVFNPPFRAEAERRTRQISDEVSRYSDDQKRKPYTSIGIWMAFQAEILNAEMILN